MCSKIIGKSQAGFRLKGSRSWNQVLHCAYLFRERGIRGELDLKVIAGYLLQEGKETFTETLIICLNLLLTNILTV